MRLYHVTNQKIAEYVRANGFDSDAGLGDPVLFLSYRPAGDSYVDAEHRSSSVLAVEIPDEMASKHKMHRTLCADAATDMYLVPLSVLEGWSASIIQEDQPAEPS